MARYVRTSVKILGLSLKGRDMADSPAVRQRRLRAHQAGDHSLCVRCDRAGMRVGPLADVDPVVDPLASLARLAGRLEAAHIADPGNAPLARELRQTLLVLGSNAPSQVDDIDRIRQSWEADLES